jgi:hypothetical protein
MQYDPAVIAIVLVVSPAVKKKAPFRLSGTGVWPA